MKRIYLNTPIKSLGRRQTLRIANMAVTWCKKHMGINNRKQNYPSLYFTTWLDGSDLCGEYDDKTNEIFIYYNNCVDVRELISTIIHEWQHQLQPLRTQYFKYKGPYCRNPFEVEARKVEKNLLNPLWVRIRSKVNRKKYLH